MGKLYWQKDFSLAAGFKTQKNSCKNEYSYTRRLHNQMSKKEDKHEAKKQSSDIIETDKDNFSLCRHCRRTSCIWRDFTEHNKRTILDLKREVDSGSRPGDARKSLYRIICREMNGVMGAGRRKRLPKCVEDSVRKLFPSEDGKYMGYKDK